MNSDAVSKAHHSDEFCKEMTQAGYRTIYRKLVKMEHCGPMDVSTLRAAADFVAEA